MRELHDQHAAAQGRDRGPRSQAAETAAHERRTAEAASPDAQEKLKQLPAADQRASAPSASTAPCSRRSTPSRRRSRSTRSRASPPSSGTSRPRSDLAALRESFARARGALRDGAGPLGGREAGVARQVAELQGARSRPARAAAARRSSRSSSASCDRYRGGALAAVRRIERGPRGRQGVALRRLQLPRAAAGRGRDPQQRHPGPVRRLQAHPLPRGRRRPEPEMSDESVGDRLRRIERAHRRGLRARRPAPRGGAPGRRQQDPARRRAASRPGRPACASSARTGSRRRLAKSRRSCRPEIEWHLIGPLQTNKVRRRARPLRRRPLGRPPEDRRGARRARPAARGVDLPASWR